MIFLAFLKNSIRQIEHAQVVALDWNWRYQNILSRIIMSKSGLKVSRVRAAPYKINLI
jgi:hypothetical protein